MKKSEFLDVYKYDFYNFYEDNTNFPLIHLICDHRETEIIRPLCQLIRKLGGSIYHDDESISIKQDDPNWTYNYNNAEIQIKKTTAVNCDKFIMLLTDETQAIHFRFWELGIVESLKLKSDSILIFPINEHAKNSFFSFLEYYPSVILQSENNSSDVLDLFQIKYIDKKMKNKKITLKEWLFKKD